MTEETLWGPLHRPAMSALLATIAIASYNNLAVAAALPDIGDDLGHIGLLPWIITLELLTSAVAVLAAGPVVDSLGVRRIFRWAGLGFIVTSVIVAAAPSMTALIAARAVQGVFAGAVMTVAMAGIGVALPARLRPRAFASISAVWGMMGIAGPAIAAVIVALVGWRGVFLVNIPVTTLALAVGWNRLPDRQIGATHERTDTVGLFLVALITVGALSLTTARPAVMIAGAALALAAGLMYRRWAAHISDPVVRLPHLVDIRYRSIHITSMAVLAGGVGANSFLPLYVRGARGGSTALAAFSVLYMTVGWSISAQVSSRLQDRWAGEWVSLLGALLALPGAGFVALVVHVDAPLPLVYLAFVWLGAGVGMITSTGSALLQNRTGIEEMGRLNAGHQFLRTLAITLGIATVAAITLTVVDNRTGDVEAVRELLGDNGTSASAELVAALSDGYAHAATVAAVVVAISVPAAIHLVRTRLEQLPSAM